VIRRLRPGKAAAPLLFPRRRAAVSRHTPFHCRSHPLRPLHRSMSHHVATNRAGAHRLPHPRLHPPDATGEDPSLGLRRRLTVHVLESHHRVEGRR
jgi:hypothetical protein